MTPPFDERVTETSFALFLFLFLAFLEFLSLILSSFSSLTGATGADVLFLPVILEERFSL